MYYVGPKGIGKKGGWNENLKKTCDNMAICHVNRTGCGYGKQGGESKKKRDRSKIPWSDLTPLFHSSLIYTLVFITAKSLWRQHFASRDTHMREVRVKPVLVL